MIYSLLVAIIIWTAYYYWTKYNDEKKTNRQIEVNHAINKTKVKLTDEENIYRELRDKALSTTAEQLKLNLDGDKPIVYGVVIDWNIGQANVTIVAFKTGDASIYLSTGQIYIGGYAHEKIRTAALDLIDEAQNNVTKAKITYYTEELDKNNVSFYFLTNKHTFNFRQTFESLVNNSSEWTKLFDLGNKVVAEYRKIVDNRTENLADKKGAGGRHGV